jgi:hypothetical protein
MVPNLLAEASFGSEEDPLDRELQSRELARIMARAYPHPTIFLGYVVTKPHAEQRKNSSVCQTIGLKTSFPAAPYDILVTDGKMHDADHEDWDRWSAIDTF